MHLETERNVDSGAIIRKATSSIKWLYLGEGIARVMSPFTFVVLARLLSPKEYGLVAVAQIAISFAQIFYSGGLEKAMIQAQTSAGKTANVVFWANLTLGVCAYGVMFLFSPAIAAFFKTPEASPVLRVLGLQIIIGSLGIVQQTLFLRALDFRQLFWIKLVNAAVPPLLSIPFALGGLGVWALVAGSMTGSVVNLVNLWARSSWRPTWGFDFSLARRLSGFGFWVVSENLISWIMDYGDGIAVGRFLSVYDLGVYRTGQNIVSILFGLGLNPLLPALFPTFSRLQHDVGALHGFLDKTNRSIAAMVLPMGAGVCLVAPQAVALAFGGKWHGLALVLGVLCLAMSIGWLVGANSELYRAIGRPDVSTRLGLINLAFMIPVFLIAAPYGLKVFVFARLGLVIASLPLHIFWVVRLLHKSPFYYWQNCRSMILSTLAMALGTWSLRSLLVSCGASQSGIPLLASTVLAGVAVYGVCLWLLDRSFVMGTARLLLRIARNQ